jgi:hypothetical protein
LKAGSLFEHPFSLIAASRQAGAFLPFRTEIFVELKSRHLSAFTHDT